MKKSTILNFLDVLSSKLSCCSFSKRKISKSNFLGFDVRAVLPFIFMAIAMTSFTVTAQNLPGTVPVLTPVGGFGIDGEGDANFPTAGIGDWFLKTPPYPGTGGSLFDASMNPLYPAMTFFLQDAWGDLDPTTFTSSNKINDDPTTYTWGPGNVPDKNEIQNVGVHFAYANPALVLPARANDLWCIFAADRQVTNGDAYIDFEFLQKPLTKSGTTNGGFLSEGTADGRTVGDLLVTLIFTNGGTSAEVQIRTWQPASKGYEYVLQPNSNYIGSIFVTNNNAPATVPFDVYGTTPGVYVPNQWVEGAVNLTQLLNFGANPCAQVSTLFVRTKTSQSVSAELKDFPVDLIQLNLGAPEVMVSCPNNVTLPACSTQEQVNTAFAAWKAGFSYEGGVPPIVESYAYTGGAPVDMGTLLPPSICGGTISITYTVTDFCEQTDSCSATFTVTAPAPAVIIDKPDYTLEGCNPAWPSVVSTTYTFCGVEGTVNGIAGEVQTDGCTQYIDYTFNYTDSCSNQAVSQTTRVSRHYDMTAPVIVDKPDVVLEGCNPAWPTVVTTTYTDNCDAGGSINGVAGEVQSSQDGCTQYIDYTFNFTDSCSNPAAPQVTRVSRHYDMTAPEITCSANLTLDCGSTPVFEAPTATDNCTATNDIVIVPGEVVIVNNADGTVSYTKSWYAEDSCGNQSTSCDQVITVLTCNAHCTYTQGYYGNPGGMSCADGEQFTTYDLIAKALAFYGGTMTIGLPGYSVYMTAPDDIDDIIRVLPGGGSSYALLAGDIRISASGFSSYLRKGNINNTLLAQTITLGLNLGIDGTLGGFVLQAGMDANNKPIELATAMPEGGCGSDIPMPRGCSLPEGYGSPVNEYEYYAFPAFVNGMTVQELYTWANTALGGGTLPAGVTLSGLASAVDMVNNAFDGCRISMGYGVERKVCDLTSPQAFVAFEVPIVNNQLTIKYKFSYVSDVTIDVFDGVTGVKLFSKADTNSYLDKEVKLDYNFNTGTQKVYIVRLTTRLGHDEQKVLSSPY